MSIMAKTYRYNDKGDGAAKKDAASPAAGGAK
jgi:Tfp pilus assembly protein PilO